MEAIQQAWDASRQEAHRQAILTAAKTRQAARTTEQINAIKIKWNNNRVAHKLGVKQGTAMTFEEANALRGNPMFGTSVDYNINCQSCVVANELRRRGFDVQAFGRIYEEQDLIARDATLAWIDPKTGVKSTRQYAGITSKGAITKTQQIKDLNDFTKEEGRYTIGIAWTYNRGRHIITAERLKNGELVFYDPQCGRKYSYPEWMANEYNPDVSKKKDIRIQRIDNLLVNISIIKNIVKGI